MAIITVVPLDSNKVRATFEAPVNINVFDVMMCKLGIEVEPGIQITHLDVVETPEPTIGAGCDTPTEMTFPCPGGNCLLTVGRVVPDVFFSSVPEGGFGDGKLVLDISYAPL